MAALNRGLLFGLIGLCLWMHPAFAALLEKEQVKANIIQIVQDRLFRDYGVATKDMQIQLTNWKLVDLQESRAASVDFDLPEDSNLFGKTSIPLKIYNKWEEEIGVQYVRIKTDIFGKRFKSRRVIRKGERITANDISTSYGSIYGEPLNRIKSRKEAIGKVARYTIGVRSTLTADNIADPPLIQSGQAIEILIQKPNIKISVQGTALEDGRKNDIIRAKTGLESAKLIKGKAINDRQIEIHRF